MNIYCIIFMCTFGANNTDTEMPSRNSLALENNGNGTDVASMILPEKGEPVPQFGDFVMELPKEIGQIRSSNTPDSASSAKSEPKSNDGATNRQDKLTPSLTDILLPPVPLRGQKL